MAKDDDKKNAASQGTGVVKAPANAPAVAYDYGTDKGSGFEDTKGSDLSIPFIMILQSNSPQVEQSNPPGAKTGMLFNSVTHVLIDGNYDKQTPGAGIVFIPCHREDKYVEWTPRDAGGGIVERHDPSSKIVKDAIAKADKKFGKIRLANGNDLVETYYVYGLILDKEGASVEGFAVVSCSGTKIKPFKHWFTAMYMVKGKPPLFAHRTLIGTFPDSNKKGKFANYTFSPFKGDIQTSMINPATEGALLTAARDFREMVISGAVKAATEHRDSTEAEVDPDADPQGDGKAPF